MAKKIKVKLKPYNSLKDNFTQVANTMHQYIPDPYTFTIYFYLCMRYNSKYNYAFPSYSSISRDCKIGLTKTKASVKCLCENKYIAKGKITDKEGFCNNIYYIRYLDIDTEKIQEEEESTLVIECEEEYMELEIE